MSNGRVLVAITGKLCLQLLEQGRLLAQTVSQQRVQLAEQEHAIAELRQRSKHSNEKALGTPILLRQACLTSLLGFAGAN